MNDELLVEMTPIEDKSRGIIKVIGVGGGGGNAVKNMYRKNTEGISYAVCNTDSQALSRTEIPVRIQLGSEGLGVGGDPMIGRAKAEESMKEIESLLSDGTQMVFITAGMGGGTGTGAAPVIAQMARERGILTIGVVTIPFAFEKRKRIEKALGGVMQLEKNVDALLVINNERLMEIYSDGITTCTEAFEHADDILSVSTHSIAEVITVEGIINRDFCDVKAVMQNGGSAIISIGYGEGEHRILKAVENALDSPLLTGVDIEHAQKMLCIVYTGQKRPVKISEMSEIQDFMDTLSPDLDVFFGLYPDEALDEEVKVSIIATGFNNMADIIDPADNSNERIQQLKGHYYGTKEKSAEGAKASPTAGAVTNAKAGQSVSATATAADGEPLIIIPDVPETEPTSTPCVDSNPKYPNAPSTSAAADAPGASAPRRRWVDRVSEYIKYIISED
ncbi:MAG: cell division protein FtsZ [Bacteroidales bacterium]|nr:cell division protein FtsZ [Bacteroidales bacterium]